MPLGNAVNISLSQHKDSSLELIANVISEIPDLDTKHVYVVMYFMLDNTCCLFSKQQPLTVFRETCSDSEFIWFYPHLVTIIYPSSSRSPPSLPSGYSLPWSCFHRPVLLFENMIFLSMSLYFYVSFLLCHTLLLLFSKLFPLVVFIR